MINDDVYRDWYLPSRPNEAIVNGCVLRNIDLNLQGQSVKVSILASKGWKKERTTITIR